jgi:hypothetical protein
MAHRDLLSTTNDKSLWGDITAKLATGNGTTVDCEVNPVPNLKDLFDNHGALLSAAACAAAGRGARAQSITREVQAQ